MKWLWSVVKKADPPADYIGQYLASRIIHTTLTVTVILSLVCAYSYNDIFIMGYIYIIGSILTILMVVPSWPIFRRNPVSSLSEKRKTE